MRRSFHPGEILIRQGDPADCVLQVVDGSVEIQREVGDLVIVLGIVGAGELIGEMGVIERRPRNATARALSEVEVEQFGVAEFFERVSADPAMARELILRLSVRLREIEDKIADDLPTYRALAGGTAVAAAAARALPGPGRLRLVADTSALRRQIGAGPIVVDGLPFLVGRKPWPGEKTPKQAASLALDDSQPFRLSRLHFMIADTPDGLVVRDLDSALGTTVNGQPIGHHFRTDAVGLDPGRNRIVAGGAGSDFAFTALVQ